MNKMQVRAILERAGKSSVKMEAGTLRREGRADEAEMLEEFQEAVKDEINNLRRHDHMPIKSGKPHAGECVAQYAIIYSRYMEEESWIQVERKVHYSERQARTIHNRGLERLGWAFESNEIIRSFWRLYIKGGNKKTAGNGS